MSWVLYFFGLLYVGTGAAIILDTAESRGLMDNLTRKTDPRALAILPLVGGLLLLAASGSSHYGWFIRLLGLMALIKCGLMALNPAGLWTKVTAWFVDGLSDRGYRAYGIIAVVLGTFILSSIR